MKSSLLALTVVSTLVLTGCFNRSDNCVSCTGDETSETMACSTCPGSADMMAEELMMDNGSGPEEVEEIELSEEEK